VGARSGIGQGHLAAVFTAQSTSRVVAQVFCTVVSDLADAAI
jgi:hypothetical protein